VAVAARTSFPITVLGVTNPVTTTPTTSFTIKTYYSNLSTPVDTLSSGLTLSAVAVQLQSASLTSSSLTVAANSSYTFTMQTKNPVPAGSSFTVTFPSDFPNAANAALSSFSVSSVTVACTMSTVSTMKFSFTNCFPSAAAAQSSLVLVISNIINPYSTKTSASAEVEFSFNGLLMEYRRDGLTSTMSTPTALSFTAITPTDPTVNALTNYLLSLSFALTHYPGDSIILTFPSTISINSSFACSTSTSGLTVSCVQASSSSLKVTLGGTVGAAVGVAISNIRNNWYTGGNVFTVKTTTNDSATYYV
jgi:hypothetical protein